jgi:hypothetical protein
MPNSFACACVEYDFNVRAAAKGLSGHDDYMPGFAYIN